MKLFLIGLLNDIICGSLFVIGTVITWKYGFISGIISYAFAYLYLDLHSYIDKKYNYPNNWFI